METLFGKELISPLTQHSTAGGEENKKVPWIATPRKARLAMTLLFLDPV